MQEKHVIRVDPHRLEAEWWRRYHAFRRRRQRELRPDVPVMPDGAVEHELRHPGPDEIPQLVLARGDAEVAAAAMVWRPRPGAAGYETSRGIVWAEIYVLPDWRRSGLGRALLAEALAVGAAEDEIRTFGVGVEDPDGRAAATAYGFQLKQEERHSRADLSTVDWAMVEDWVRRGADRDAGRRLEMHVGGPPEAIWPEYCPAMTQLFNTIPWDDLDHGDVTITPDSMRSLREMLGAGRGTIYTLLAREADGRISGLTEAVVWDEQPEHAHQWLTAVDARVRGQGVGRWLKAAMLLRLRQDRPRLRWMLTDNAGSNAPMLKINRELGFQPYHSVGLYQVPGEALRTRLRQG